MSLQLFGDHFEMVEAAHATGFVGFLDQASAQVLAHIAFGLTQREYQVAEATIELGTPPEPTVVQVVFAAGLHSPQSLAEEFRRARNKK